MRAGLLAGGDAVDIYTQNLPPHLAAKVRAFNHLKLSSDDLVLLLYSIHQFVNYDGNTIDLSRALRSIFPSDVQYTIRREFMHGRSELQKKNLLQLESADLKSDKTVELTEKAVEMFIPGLLIMFRHV